MNDDQVQQTTDLSLLFESLLNLIKQVDDQLTLASQYHFTVIGSLIPIIALLVTVNTHWLALVGIMCLALALAAHWGITTTKLTLQKLCWVRLARKVEAQVFGEDYGPFTTQQRFFADLPNQNLRRKEDKLLVEQIGLANTRFLPIALLTTAILIAATVGIVAR